MLSEQDKGRRPENKRVEKPDNVEITQGMGLSTEALTITIKPQSPRSSTNLLQLVVVIVFVVFPLTNYRYHTDSIIEDRLQLAMAIIFIVIWAAIIFKMLYKTLIDVFNKVTISIDGTQLKIKAGPLPQPGVVDTFETSRIMQIFCVRHKNKQRRGFYYSYSLNVQTLDGSVCLLEGMGKAQALFAEQTLEDTLGIVDRVTTGEFPSTR